MKPFFNSRTKCNTAFVVLWVWLFALASGAANACLIQAGDMHDQRSRAAHSQSLPAEEDHAISAIHGHTIPDHDDSGLDASKSQCLNVCDDGSQSLTKQRVGFDLTHPVMAPLFASAWAPATPMVSRRGLAVIQRPPDPKLPIRVRLSRLAL